jgi:hypothetical protein
MGLDHITHVASPKFSSSELEGANRPMMGYPSGDYIITQNCSVKKKRTNCRLSAVKLRNFDQSQ